MYYVIYDASYHALKRLNYLACHRGPLPPLNIDDASVFSSSEHLVQEHVKKYKTGAAELKDLIQQVLHRPDFNPDDVDHEMHEMLMDCIAAGNIKAIYLWEDSDGDQEVMLYEQPIFKVLRELLGDERLAGC
jgi:hypothetical protein